MRTPRNRGLFAGCWTEDEFATERRKSKRFLREERRLGKGPAYIKDGRLTYYPIPTSRQWLMQGLHEPVTRPEPPQPEPRAARRLQAARKPELETTG